MAFPTTGALDTFNRADGALGANWTGGFAGDANNLTIVSNAATSASTSAFGGSSWNTQIGPDFELWVLLAAGFDAGATNELWLEVFDSQSSSSMNGFAVVIGGDSSSSWKGLHMVRFDTGTPTTLITDTTQTWAAADSFGFTRTGTTLQAWRKTGAGAWTQVGTDQTDSHYLTALWPGAEVMIQNVHQATIDTFNGGTLSTIPAIRPNMALHPKSLMRR